MITEETVKKQLDTLHQEGTTLAAAFAEEKETEPFEVGYQRWYSRALLLMKQLAPERYAEFQRYYNRDPKADLHWKHDHAIQDYICGLGLSDPVINRKQVLRCFSIQLAILRSVADRLEWQALDTDDQAARSLHLGVLEAARDLIKISERAAGALAGVVLLAHLKKLAAKHQVNLRKQSPAPAELAEALKAAKVIDVPVHSQLTWLAEIRDRCLQPQGEVPTKLQVRDLVDGTHWLLTNVF